MPNMMICTEGTIRTLVLKPQLVNRYGKYMVNAQKAKI